MLFFQSVRASLAARAVRAAAAFGALLGAPLLSAGPIDDLQPGHWYEVPDSKLRSVTLDIPQDNVEAVISAWSGGAFDSARNRLIIWGGGHADYSGNEIYVFDVDTLSWSRLTDPPSNVGGDTGSGVYPNGTPRSRHTYNYIEYVPSIDRFCSFGGAALYPSGNVGTTRVDCFNFDTKQWSKHANVPDSGGKIESTSTLDALTGRIYHKNNNTSKMAIYNANNDSWQEAGPSFAISSKRTTAIDPERRKWVIIGEGVVGVWDLDSQDYEKISTSGSGPGKRSPGVQYDPVSDRIVVWEGGSNVYTLNLDNRSWTRHSPAASNSVSGPQQAKWGTYGRFRYVPSKNVFIVVSDIDENVFFYKLAPGGPDDPPPAPPGNVHHQVVD